MNVAKTKGWEIAVRGVVYHRNDTEFTRAVCHTRWYSGPDKAISAGKELILRRRMDPSCYCVQSEYAD
jgi:hypothetical protein